MMPVFSSPAGFWALLGVPLLVVIHILQQRSRSEITSTLFLLEKLAPESRGGRMWDRWRTSRAFWLQVLAVLLATWVLTGPRWVRGESAQTVVLVLDSAVSMEAFRDDAVRAAERIFAASAGRAARTEWVVLTSDPRQPPLYRGPEQTAAVAALAAWRPRMGTHDYAPALRLARSLAGGAGETWLVTDSNLKVPKDQPAVGVGRVIQNVGFAGASVEKTDAGLNWRALVKNNTDSPQRREWWFEQGGVRSSPQVAELAAGALLEIGGRFPDGAMEGVLVLAADGFGADDRLPLVRPVPKRLTAGVELKGEEGLFFRKLLAGIDGVSIGGTGAPALRVARLGAEENPAAGAAIFLPPVTEAARRLQTAPVVAERDALVADLNWQGLLGPGAAGLKRGPGDEVLLWQAEAPLVWLRPGEAPARQLVLNLDWESGNAPRLPAMVLLLRRFVEAVRAAQPGFYADNFDSGARVPLAARDQSGGGGEWVLVFEPADGGAASKRVLTAAELAVLRAPGEAGFFTVSRGAEQRVRGAVHFVDARQGDFRGAGTFDTGRGAESEAVWERATRPDPFTKVWLALLGGVLLASWWPAGAKGGRAR